MRRGPIVVLGASGQVGSALAALLKDRCVAFSRSEADLTAPEKIIERLGALSPSALINAAAYTQVDKAEQEQELSFQINAVTPGVLAQWCREQGIPFVHYSTDYVFPGTGVKSWREEDVTDPLNAYGKSKLEGERRIAEVGGQWLVFRTSWVYDATGKNFLNTMLRLGRERETLRVVADQHGAPTYAPQLARATLQALAAAEKLPGFPSGVYHLCGGGETTWHGFASAIFDRARAFGIDLRVNQVQAISSSEFPTPARRPFNSRMDQSKVSRVLGVTMPDWEEGLEECFSAKERAVL